jgi:hypothetical protein
VVTEAVVADLFGLVSVDSDPISDTPVIVSLIGRYHVVAGWGRAPRRRSFQQAAVLAAPWRRVFELIRSKSSWYAHGESNPALHRERVPS